MPGRIGRLQYQSPGTQVSGDDGIATGVFKKESTMKATMMKTVGALAITMMMVVSSGVASAQEKKMPKPETVTISGTLIDMSCAAKGKVMMGNNHNAENDDHMTPRGEVESCATMCLKGGQPAGIYSKGKIQATLLANASLNLYKFAAKDVEVQGFWAGDKNDRVKTFVPAKIRLAGTRDWPDVQTAQMH